MSLDQDVRTQFPQLSVKVRDRRLVYLDSGATALKPLSVIEAVRRHMSEGTANVHRGAHHLSDRATEQYEGVRDFVRDFVGAADRREIVFTRGTTEGVNLIAQTLGQTILNEGDEILLSQMEHHSNIVPWQMVAQQRGAHVKFIPVLEDGSLDQTAFQKLLNPRTKILSLVHVSNALGTLNPLAEMFRQAKVHGTVCVVDAAQSVAVLPLRVRELGCDFLVFSGHKVFAPAGVGVLYGKLEWLERLPPYQGGGSMIREVLESGSDYLPSPHRFEAGTPAIGDILGLGAALEFVTELGFEKIHEHDSAILDFATTELARVPSLRWIGTARERRHLVSFLLGEVHPSDVGAVLDEQGIALRSGHHCCQPLMRRFSIPGTVRASFSVYTSEVDIVDLVRGVRKAQELLQ